MVRVYACQLVQTCFVGVLHSYPIPSGFFVLIVFTTDGLAGIISGHAAVDLELCDA